METFCPHCAKALNAHTDFANSEPKHGDISLCIGCGFIAVFNLEKQCLRAPSEEEQAEIDAMPQVHLFRSAWIATKRNE